MRLDKLTLRAQEALEQAQTMAREKGHPQIEPEHLLWAMLRQEDGTAVRILARMGAPVDMLLGELERQLGRMPRVEGTQQLYISNTLQAGLDLAQRTADKLKDDYVTVEHLLIGLADLGAGDVPNLLRSNGVTKEKILEVLKSIRGSQRVTDQSPEDKYEALSRYGRDLTEMARLGKLDPVIGRDEEIRRTIQVLSRRT